MLLKMKFLIFLLVLILPLHGKGQMETQGFPSILSRNTTEAEVVAQVSPEVTERLTREIIAVACEEEITSYSVLSKSIRILSTIATSNENSLVTEATLENVINITECFHAYITENPDLVSTNDREMIVETLGRLLNRVDISSPSETFSYGTDSFTVEVRYIGRNTNLTFASPSKDVEIAIPEDAIELVNGTTGAGNRSRLTFILYEDDLLFNSEFESNKVVSAQINGQAMTKLITPVTYSVPTAFNGSDEASYYIRCSWWDFTISDWSNDGCYLVRGTNPPSCACTQMSNFAILVMTISNDMSETFDIINSFVIWISCFGLFLTIAIYMYFRELRTSKVGPLHINLCICLFIGYAVLLYGSDKVEQRMICFATTLLCHFFFVASWFWMLVEAYVMYMLFVKKVQYLGNKFLLRSSLVSYLVPFVIVVTSAVSTTVLNSEENHIVGWTLISSSFFGSGYTSNTYCWLAGPSLHYGFLTVAAFIFTTNIVLYILVIRAITWGRKKIRSTREEATSSDHIRRAVAVGFVVGITWVLIVPIDVLSHYKVIAEPLTFTFTVLITLQGVVIFYLLCVGNVTARRLWLDPICKRIRAHVRCCRAEGINEDTLANVNEMSFININALTNVTTSNVDTPTNVIISHVNELPYVRTVSLTTFTNVAIPNADEPTSITPTADAPAHVMTSFAFQPTDAATSNV